MLKRNLTGIYLTGCVAVTPLLLNLLTNNWLISFILTMTVIPSYAIAYISINIILAVLRIGQFVGRHFSILSVKSKSFINFKFIERISLSGLKKQNAKQREPSGNTQQLEPGLV
jgi:hypothetical protein